MSQVSDVLRRQEGGYTHYCPGCERAHSLPDGWSFNGNLERPTFSPSFKHTTPVGPPARVCHYILTNGILNFCGDSTHGLAGLSVPLPSLPPGLRDDNWPESDEVKSDD